MCKLFDRKSTLQQIFYVFLVLFKVISEDLNTLKSMISKLESKLSEQSNECINMETEQCESLAKTHGSFKSMLQTVNVDLHSKMQDTNNIIIAIEDTNEEFIKDFSSVVENCLENTSVGSNVDEEIKVIILLVIEMIYKWTYLKRVLFSGYG